MPGLAAAKRDDVGRGRAPVRHMRKRWRLGCVRTAPATKGDVMNLDDLPVVERTRSLARVGGDLELLMELYGVFASVVPERIAELRKALTAAEMDAVWRVPHPLTGAWGGGGAARCRAPATHPQTAARGGERAAARSLLPLVEQGLADVLGSLALGHVET